MFRRLILVALLFASAALPAIAQYPGWQHEASLYILTTPEGADIPAGVVERDFPLLVRLYSDGFPFQQANTHGEDVRFSQDGKPLAYQIDEWNPQKGVAAIWVRIPVIRGDSRQEIKLHWGKSNAASESRGEAVFNASNGYRTVMHLSDPANPGKDEVGTLMPTDTGTVESTGVIGGARRFSPGKGISAGDNILGFPTGANDHTTEVWIRPDAANAIAIAWGNEHSQGKVTMRVNSPPHIRMECYFSGADVKTATPIAMSQWMHVVHTYHKGDSRIYLNGRLDGVSATSSAPLGIKSPAHMYLGGWYDNYAFAGDIDEARISNVVRSPEWIKLEYENQKPMQTLVGAPVQHGTAFEVSQASVTLDEGTRATVSAKADGSQKVYWIVKRDGRETIVAVDRLSYTIPAGRVSAKTSFTLEFKAVYGDGVKTKEIPVTIRDTLPDPKITLSAPARWNGRSVLQIAPTVRNMSALIARNVQSLRYRWSISGGAVVKQIVQGRLILLRSQYTGPLTVTVTVDNGGAPAVDSRRIVVTEPQSDPWVARVPGADERPEEGQFYARDDKSEGTLHYNGTLDRPADSVFLNLYADGKLVKTETQKPKSHRAYALTVKLKPGLIRYSVAFGTVRNGTKTVEHTVNDLVCGDAWLIDGQSNALATDTGEKSPPETSEWIRSYARPNGDEKQLGRGLWRRPVWKAESGEEAELGWWGMELARRLVSSTGMPVFIINGAVGGTRIDQHQRNPANPLDLGTIYGRLLWRVRSARMTHGIRGVIWHQGEADQGSDGPDGGYGWETYQQYFIDMSACWKQDFPNIQHYYLFQIWPNACSQGAGHGDMLREVQRTLPRLYSHMDIMPTLGIRPPGPCHFPLAGWSQFAGLLQPLIERDFYDKSPIMPITAPNLKRAYYTDTTKTSVALEFDQSVAWTDSLSSQFYLDGAANLVTSGRVTGNTLILKLKAPSTAKRISYVTELHWDQDHLLIGDNGIAVLTFCDVPIVSGRLR